MHLAPFVARLLQHPEHPIVSLDMITRPIDVFPTQKHDHLVKLLFANLLR
jgi:hypothetical protein